MLTKLKFIVEFAVFYLLTIILYYLPYRVSIKTGAAIGRLLYRLSGRRRNITIDNISAALDVTREEAGGIARRALENIGVTFAEFIKLPTLDDRFFEENIEIAGFNHYIEAKGKGKGILFLGAHLGNWELLGASHQRREGAMSVVYRPTSNPYVSRYIDSLRRSAGLQTIPSRNAARKIMSDIKKGGSVGILLDQHAVDEEAINVDFFGRPAATSYGLALIALKTGTPVVPLFLTREENHKFLCHYGKPIYLKKGEDLKSDIKEATQLFNRIIEEMIRKYPEQWFWLHRRWKV